MKQVLLRVAGIRTEMRGGKLLELAQTHPASAKIVVAQELHNPHVDWESSLAAEGKQQDAIAYLSANTFELEQFGAGRFERHLPQGTQIKLALSDAAGRAEQEGCAKSHFTRAQLRFGQASQSPGSWKDMRGRLVRSDRHRSAIPAAQQRNDLPDLNNLFGRGQDKRGQALPRILTEQAQSAARGHRIVHSWFWRKCA